MRASRYGQPARAAVPAGQPSRGPGAISPVETSTRRTKGSGPAISTLKRKKAAGPLSCTKVEVAAGEDWFAYTAANSDVHPCSSNYEQVTDISSLVECPWPNWPDWGSEREHGGAGSTVESPTYSEASSTLCSHSDSESDLLWSTTSSSSGSKLHEPSELRTTFSFWEELLWGQRRPWKMLQHRRWFLTNLWDFKSETKAEESSDPILVCVNVMGSPGPLRLVVDRNDSVKHTIDFALRRYADQKRLPKLVGPTPVFGLYCRNPDFEALNDEDRIGHRSARQFHLYHKQRTHLSMEDMDMDEAASWKSSGTTTSAAIRNSIWNKLKGMRSWVGSMVTSVSHTLTYWVKYLNPQKLYRFVYITSKRAVSLAVA